jgi:hypothetical protein
VRVEYKRRLMSVLSVPGGTVRLGLERRQRRQRRGLLESKKSRVGLEGRQRKLLVRKHERRT